MSPSLEKIPNENELNLNTEPNYEDITTILSLLDLIPKEIKNQLFDVQPEKLAASPAEKEWSIVQNLAHIRSCADVWGDTIQKMLIFDNPTIRYQSPRSWPKFKVYSKMEFWDSFLEFESQRQQLLDTLRTLQFNDWQRKSSIKERTHSIYSQCRRMVNHELVHFYQIKKTISSF